MTFNWHEAAQQRWDEGATNWHEGSKNMWDTGSRSSILPFFLRHVEQGAIVLDVGCGDGYGTSKFNAAGYRMCGIDLSEEMIRIGKTRGENDTLSFVQGDLTKLPYASESFDAIIAINSLEWTEKPLHALQEIHRVLRPKGKACIAILGPTAAPRVNSYRRLYDEPVICNTMMPWELERLGEENGFTVLDGEGVYKRGVDEKLRGQLPVELQQALTFLWLFMLEKN